VQQALRMALEPIFEADFHPCSHGFRRNRSTHTALGDVTYKFSRTTWTIEGDIVGCFDNIPHGKLLKAIEKRVADGKVLHLIQAFLAAGYLEQWQYHQTYSGTPQGGILSPLLCNIFLHQLDEYMMQELHANENPSRREQNARRNPEYRRIDQKIQRLRRKFKQTLGPARKTFIKELNEQERQLRSTPYYAKERRHRSKIGYVRYADDFVILVQGKKQDAQTIKNEVREKLQEMGLALSEEKTKLTHWRHLVRFLGYQLHGKPTRKGTSIKPILSIPHEKLKGIKGDLKAISGYHNIPEIDAIIQMSAMFRGWCNYYRYATAPQAIFNNLASHTWWCYAHYVARKHKLSIAKMLKQEKQAGRHLVARRNGRNRTTFQIQVENRTVMLDLFPPRTGYLIRLATTGNGIVDLKPVKPANWQSGRSLATRMTALERARGICERCGKNPVAHVHHTVPVQGKTFLARVMSDSAQRYTAEALCQECHLEKHSGSYAPRKRKGQVG
jgi:group II intron reverse transcriptase/maturase